MDKNHFVGAILMDLSKAFDCLPPELILEKLRAYGLAESAIDLLKSYLSHRRQCIKIGNTSSTFLSLTKGVPQGSILGPLLFNIFINDIFLCVNKTKLFNYADDNTLSYAHANYQCLKQTLESESESLIEWFTNNQMQANPDKFQALAVGERTQDKIPAFSISNIDIKCDETVKLLGVDIDFRLSYDQHLAALCKKSSRQLNVLIRIGKYLTLEGRKAIYHAFIMSNFNFCPLVWHFCKKSASDKLEKINFRALKFVYQDFDTPYENLLSREGTPSLHLGRLRKIAIETFKIIHDNSPPYLKDLVDVKTSNYSFRNKNVLDTKRFRTKRYGHNSFKYAAPNIWNSLPQECRAAVDIKTFKTLLNTWCGSECKCALCKK